MERGLIVDATDVVDILDDTDMVRRRNGRCDLSGSLSQSWN